LPGNFYELLVSGKKGLGYWLDAANFSVLTLAQ
jgi:hypothetical protein